VKEKIFRCGFLRFGEGEKRKGVRYHVFIYFLLAICDNFKPHQNHTIVLLKSKSKFEDKRLSKLQIANFIVFYLMCTYA